VIENMLPFYRQDVLHSIIPAKEFYPLYEKMMPSKLEERLQMKGLPANRADLIIVAYLLIHLILQKADIQNIVISAYAMKEGALFEMMRN